MEKRVTKKLLAILMIITILATDFYALGSELIAYAADSSAVVISAYFKDGNNKVETVNKSIKDENVKLYVDITVNSGYFTAKEISVQNGNFNIKSSNEIKFEQINAGESKTIALDIEPVTSDEITVGMLSKTSTVVVTGDYTDSNSKSELETETISVEDEATVKYQPDETASAELETEIITNKVLSVNGTNKRVVQLLLKSRLTENQYPLEYAELTISIPQLGTITKNDISVLALGKLATNGETEVSNIEVDGQELVITLENKADTNSKINWVKDAYDELVVTFMYEATVDASTIEITTSSELKLHNLSNTYTATETKSITNKELSEVIIGRTEITTEEMYKGQLYANTVATETVNIQYETKTTVGITNVGVSNKITIHEGADAFGTETSELTANTRYVSTVINKQEMQALFGESATIQVENVNTEINEVDGNIVITYPTDTDNIDIVITGQSKTTGVLEINHVKEITKNAYTRAQLQNVKTLNVKSTTSATLDEVAVTAKNATEASIELKETTTKAELTIVGDENKLATEQENTLKLGITLITDGTQYDLFKNPEITLQFPAAVESVTLNEAPVKQNASDFSISSDGYKDGKIVINLTGEQTKYPESPLTQAYLQLNLNVTLSKYAITQKDKIVMTYTNANVSKFVGTAEQSIEISGPNDLVTEFSFAENENASKLQVENGDTVEIKATLLNDTETTLNNVKILGKLPTTGNTIGENTNTLATTVQSVTAPNATVYYTENADATTDINDSANGWTENYTANTKLYLIQLDSLSRETYTATIKVKVSDTIDESKASYTNYVVTADEMTGSKTSKSIALVTDEVTALEFDIKAKVGGETLNAGDTVKEGEVITYTVTVTNSGTNTLENVEVSAAVPEGTTLVQVGPMAWYYADPFYFTEKEDTEKVATYTLEAGKSATMKYNVRVKNDATASLTEISNKVVATYNNAKIESKEFKNKLEEANIRVTIKRLEDNSQFKDISETVISYGIYIENLSDETIPANEMNLEVISDEFTVGKMIYNNTYITGKTQIPVDIEIAGNSALYIEMYGTIKADVEDLNMKVVVTDANGKYRSNTLTDEVVSLKAGVTLSSNKENKYIKTGEKVTYHISIKNTGESFSGFINTINTISNYLEIQSIAKNGTITMQTTDSTKATYISKISNDDNKVEYGLSKDMKNGDEVEIDIVAIVKDIPEEADGTVITTKTDVQFLGMDVGTSNEVKHILSLTTPEDLKNIISGTVTLDSNGNGLQGITVKLYDITNKCYLTDEDGEVITKLTDSNGNYTFARVPSGSYIVVVEYDNEKYDVGTGLTLQNVTVNGETVTVAGTETKKITDNVYDVNMGLKNKTTESNPDDPDTPTNPDDPTNPNNPEDPSQPGSTEGTKTISGFAWLDTDRDGQKDADEETLSGIKVRVYHVSTKNYLTNSNGNIIEVTTDSNGKYTLTNIEKGKYILIFVYNTEEYEPTTYFAEGVDTTQNSKVVLKNISINGQEITTAVTDTINVQENVYNINIGLKEKLIFDLELNKYISRIVVQTSKETKAYDYENSTFGKVEIHRKQIQGSLVVLEYTIKVKNAGEIAGYVKNIVDYLPSGLTFSSELNSDWYLSGSYLYTKGLENVELQPGEEKEIKLILTKTMTSENVGLINNRAEIYTDYNKYGIVDIDSTPNNQVQDEDDFGSVNVIIQVATGGSITAYIILLMINIVLICIAIRIMIKNNIIKISTKKGRR